jgi:serine/threonine protein kinase
MSFRRSKVSAPTRRDPAGTTGVPGPLQVGDLLAGRYLLLEVVAADGPAMLWRASDEVLARPVAVKVIATPNKSAREAAQPFLDAAVRTGAVNHAGLVRVYDATLEPRPGRGNDVAYVISEWVEGQPLDVHLAEVGALASPDAADVLRQAADALSAAHAAGLIHGRVHPRNVLVAASGRVRLTDAAVAAALHGLPVPGVAGRDDVRADTRDLAAVLYALVTARWPAAASDQPGGGLSQAAVNDGHPLSARQLRAGVPRALDTVITRGLNPSQAPALGPIVTPAALADAADLSVAEARRAQVESVSPPPPSRLRRGLPWAAALTVVTAFGIAGWLLGLAVGDLPRRTNGVDAIVSTTEAPTPGVKAAVPIDLSKVLIRDFDPGGDKQENADQVRNAIDSFPDTTWSTSRYRTSALGGLKGGVGLLLDLGKVTALHTMQVGFSAPGAQVELRLGDTPPTDETSLQTVAASREGRQLATLTPAPGTKARYLLVWITALPKDGDGYRVGVSELRIT